VKRGGTFIQDLYAAFARGGPGEAPGFFAGIAAGHTSTQANSSRLQSRPRSYTRTPRLFL